MSSDLLAKIERIVQSKLDFNESQIGTLKSFFKGYKVNMWIYPGVIKRKFNIPIIDVYALLDLLAKENILENYYELWCSHCQKSNGSVNTFNQLPNSFRCEMCLEELPTLENTVLIYKVIKDE